MAPTPWGSADDPERTDVVPRRASRPLPPPDVDPDKTVTVARSHGATPVVPTYPPAYYQPVRRYPAPPAPIPVARRGRGRLWAVLASGAVALSVVAVLLTLMAGRIKSLTADKLDITAAQAGVRNVLTDSTTGYGLAGVKAVICNHGANPTVVKGATFTCDLTINGHRAQATVTFIDDDGTYSVGRPE